MPDWVGPYFESGYAQRWGLPALSDRIRLEAEGLWTLLQLTGTARVIDIGCGHGRHAVALAERGSAVTGLDFAAALLSRAHELAAGRRPGVRWIRGDMRHLPFRSACASAALVVDAFGFFETDDEHDMVLREAARVLSVGGRLAMKIVNGGVVLESFRETDREERDRTLVTVSRTLTVDPPRMTEKIRLTGDFGTREYERRQRLYRVEELTAALERAGFSVTGVFAQPDGTPFQPTVSAAMWVSGRRR